MAVLPLDLICSCNQLVGLDSYFNTCKIVFKLIFSFSPIATGPHFESNVLPVLFEPLV